MHEDTTDIHATGIVDFWEVCFAIIFAKFYNYHFILQVLDIGTHQSSTDTHVVSPDTDVYSFLMDLVSHDCLPSKHHLHMYTKSLTHPVIYIKAYVHRLGKRNSQALIGLQEFTR